MEGGREKRGGIERVGKERKREGGLEVLARRGSEGNNEAAVEGGVEVTRGRNGWRWKEAIGKERQVKEGADR